MTTLLRRESTEHTALWQLMPGWGVVADLTPPELIAMRRLRVLRKFIVAALIVVVVACVGGAVFATMKESSAEDALASTRARGTELTASTGKYGVVQRIQIATDNLDARIATLMTSDTDVARLLADLRAALPDGMSVSSVNVTFTPPGGTAGAGPAAAPSSDPAAAGAVNTIGTVTMAGSSAKLADLAIYVLALQRVRGVTDVLPGTNTADGKGATWSLTLGLTKARYSHRFDVATVKAGGSR